MPTRAAWARTTAEGPLAAAALGSEATCGAGSASGAGGDDGSGTASATASCACVAGCATVHTMRGVRPRWAGARERRQAREGRVSHLHIVGGNLHCGDICRGSRLLDVIHHDCILAGGDSHLGGASHAQQGATCSDHAHGKAHRDRLRARRRVRIHGGWRRSRDCRRRGGLLHRRQLQSGRLFRPCSLLRRFAATRTCRLGCWRGLHGCGRAGQARVRAESWLARRRCNSHKGCTRTCVSCAGRRLVFSRRLCVAVSEGRAVSVGLGADTRGWQAGAHLGPQALGAPVRVVTARVQSGEPQRHGYRCKDGGATHPLAPGGCATCSRATTRRSRNHALPQNARQLPSTRRVSPVQPAHKTRHPGVGKRAAAGRRAVTNACRNVDGVVPLRPVWPRLRHAPVSVHLGQTHG